MKLINNGDDFGITKGCNYAIIECFKDGILTSTSMMTNMPAAKHAAELMKDNPKLSVGIHFNLTVGKPLTDCKTLIKDDGTFNKGMLKNSEHVNIGEIRTELQAQYDKYVELTGQKPAHLNSHHGIEMIKGGEEALKELARKYDLPIRHMFTMTEYKYDDVPYEMAKQVMIMNRDGTPNTPSEFINFFTKEQLESDDIYEYPTHPGYVDYELLQISSLCEGRVHDAHIYLCDEVKNWIKENNIELVDYSALKHI